MSERGDADDPFLGTVFADRYAVKSIIGKGGMSVVYRAMHSLMKKEVAVKMLHSQMLLSTTSLRRFQQEAQTASSLSHPNVITVYDLGVTAEGMPYIVMEYIEGTSLSELIKEKGRLKSDRCLDIFMQACQGLSAAHEKGIVHRDIKPSNVMLIARDDGGTLVKIVDFGVAKLLPTDGDEAQRLTQTGELIGSPVYMSPEQWLAQPQDARSDIYAIGCLMYEALTGKPPLVGASLYETMFKHLNEVPEGLGDAVPDAQLREQLEEILFKAMAKEPERRYQNMAELTMALERARAGRSRGPLDRINSIWETSRLKRVPKRARSALVAGLMAAVIGLLGLSGWALNALFSSPPDRFVEMQWVKVPEPAPPMPSNVVKMDKMAGLMISLVVGRKGWEAPELMERFATFARFRKQYHRWADALTSFERVLYIANKHNAPKDFDYYVTQVDLADCYYEVGRYRDAERLYPAALKWLEAGSNVDYVSQYYRLGDIYLRAGKLPEAEVSLRKAIAIMQDLRDKMEDMDATSTSALTVSKLGDVYRLEGKLDEAAATYRAAILVWQKLEGPEPPKDIALCHYYLGEVAHMKGDAHKASIEYREALELAEKKSAFGPDHRYVGNILYKYSDTLWQENHWLESLFMKARANNIYHTA